MSRTLEERILSRELPGVRAYVSALFHDLDLAEDAAQEAALRALDRWPKEGLPDKPGGWLATVARNIAYDHIRTQSNRRGILDRTVPLTADSAELESLDDEAFALICACCHPEFAVETQVAMTLRYVVGMDLAELSRAFLVKTRTMEQRLTRAKRALARSGIPLEVPPTLVGARLHGILDTVYLIFNEGYVASHGTALARRGLCEEAIRLTRRIERQVRPHPETTGLLALMLLHHSRFEARTDAEGDLVLLESQDRSRWDRRCIVEGLALVESALAMKQRPGKYQVQACIAALHARASNPAETDWSQIAGLYGYLVQIHDTPVVRMNEAVAVAFASNVEAGLRRLEALEGAPGMTGFHLYHSTRAGLLERAGRLPEAAVDYEIALEQAGNEVEKRHLHNRLAAVSCEAVAVGETAKPR